jgi:hypothetical protein
MRARHDLGEPGYEPRVGRPLPLQPHHVATFDQANTRNPSQTGNEAERWLTSTGW